MCHQTREEMEATREIARARDGRVAASPWRDRPVEENLAEFEAMRNGVFEVRPRRPPTRPHAPQPARQPPRPPTVFPAPLLTEQEGKAVLRLRIDMTSVNPTLWDPVAYRIKFSPHPMTGKKWCIYPSYDYSHGIIDSLEHIDYSLCTLEFEVGAGRLEGHRLAAGVAGHVR